MYYANARKKIRLDKLAREKKAVEKKKLPSMRFQRVSAQVQCENTDEIFAGRVFLHDLSEAGVGVFLKEPLRKGQRVFIVIEQPRHFFMRGEVAWCALFRLNSCVISPEIYQYRAGIRFIYDDVVDREIVGNYFKSILGA